MSLGRSVEVFGLCYSTQFVFISWQAAEEDGAAEGEDGGAPAEPVGPGVVVLALEDPLVELDGVDDQSDGLDDHCRDRQRVKNFQQTREDQQFDVSS